VTQRSQEIKSSQDLSKWAAANPKYKYVPCAKTGGKHQFERIRHDQFDKCIHCGEPRFAVRSLTYQGSPLCKFIAAVMP
jgi:hypothetical protein